MSQQELQRVEVTAVRRSGRIGQVEAARQLQVTERQIRRWKPRWHGAAALRSARRRRPSHRRIAPDTVQQTATLIRARYRDFGPTLASEYLSERHGLALSKGNGAPNHDHRQAVASAVHPCFDDPGLRCCLLVFIDDATNRLTQRGTLCRKAPACAAPRSPTRTLRSLLRSALANHVVVAFNTTETSRRTLLYRARNRTSLLRLDTPT